LPKFFYLIIKIAAFGFDGTIIVSLPGNIFPTGKYNWTINYEITKKIKKLSNNGYKIVIFTNQGGIRKKLVDNESLKEKIENVHIAFGIPIQVFVAFHNDDYQKPALGMWNIFISDVSQFLLDNYINVTYIFYVFSIMVVCQLTWITAFFVVMLQVGLIILVLMIKKLIKTVFVMTVYLPIILVLDFILLRTFL